MIFITRPRCTCVGMMGCLVCEEICISKCVLIDLSRAEQDP